MTLSLDVGLAMLALSPIATLLFVIMFKRALSGAIGNISDAARRKF